MKKLRRKSVKNLSKIHFTHIKLKLVINHHIHTIMFIQYKKNDLECLFIHIQQNEYCTKNDKTKDEVKTQILLIYIQYE